MEKHELIDKEFWTQEKLDELQKLAALNWSKRRIAKYFKLDFRVFKKLLDTSDIVRKTYEYGQVVYESVADVNILKSVQDGSITGIQIFNKSNEKRKFNASVNKIFFDE